jgi:hypothetical protein
MPVNKTSKADEVASPKVKTHWSRYNEEAEPRDEKTRQLTATFSRKRENLPYTSIFAHVAGFEIRETKRSELMHTYHMQNRPE